MKKTYKIKNNQTFNFKEVKTDNKYLDARKDLMTEKFNKDLNIKQLSTWELGKPKKLAESRVFDYLSDEVSPIKENKKATDFLNKLHFIEDRKNNELTKLKEAEEDESLLSNLESENIFSEEEPLAPYYTVQLKDTSEYLSFDANGEEILTKNKDNAEMFVSKEDAEKAIERFVFDSIDIDLKDISSDEDSLDSVDIIIAESKSDFIISPVYDEELKEAQKRFSKNVSNDTEELKEKSVRSVTNDVAFYIVTVLSDDSSEVKYIGKDDDDDFCTVDYKDLSEAFESLADAREAIDDMIYQVLNDIDFEYEDVSEAEMYNDMLQNYRIDAVYIDLGSLYFKPID